MRKGFASIFATLALGAVLLLGVVYYTDFKVKEIERGKLGVVTALTDTIGTFRTNVNATDEALRSTTSSDPGHVHTTASVSGTIAIAKGGLNTSTVPVANAMLIGDGTTYQFSVIPGCSNASTSKLIYTSSTRVWTCTQDTGGSASTTTDLILNSSRVSSTADFVTSTTTFGTVGTSTAAGIASTTILTNAHRVFLSFTATIYNTTASDNSFDFTVDGVAVSNNGGGRGLMGASVIAGAVNTYIPVNMTFLTDVLTAASHTFRVVSKTDTGTLHVGEVTSNPGWQFSVNELYN